MGGISWIASIRGGAVRLVWRSASACCRSLPVAAAELTVWCWDPNFNGAAMKEAGERYKATHPDVTFNIVDFAKADLEQKLQAQLASGTTDGLPDIVLIEDYGAQKYLQSFPGAFEPLSGKIDYGAFAPYKVELATVDGKTYSLPFDSGVTGLFYRSDYLQEAGFDAATLQDITWDQLIEIGKAVKAKTGHPLLGVDINDAGIIRIMLQSAGKWYFTPDGHADIAGNPTFKAALETYAKLLQSTDIYKPVAGWTEYTGAFTSGETAAVNTGVWMTGDHQGRRPVRQVGRCPDPEALERRRRHARLQPRRFQLVRPRVLAGKGRRHRFPRRNLGQGRRLLPEDPRRPGRPRVAPRRPRRRGLQGQRRLLRRPAGLAELLRLARADSGRELRHLHQRGGRGDRRAGSCPSPRAARSTTPSTAIDAQVKQQIQ